MLKVVGISSSNITILDTVDNVEESISSKYFEYLCSFIDFDKSEMIKRDMAKSKLLGLGISGELINGKEYNVLHSLSSSNGVSVEIPEGVHLISHEFWDDIRNSGVQNIKFPSTLIYL